MNFFLVEENLEYEINKVYNINDQEDLKDDIIEAIELSKDIEKANTDTHFISGSIFGLNYLGNRPVSNFQILVSYLWHKNQNSYGGNHICTFLKGSRWSPKTNEELKKSYKDAEKFMREFSVGDDLEYFKYEIQQNKFKWENNLEQLWCEMKSTFLYLLLDLNINDFRNKFQLFSDDKKELMGAYNNLIENENFLKALKNDSSTDQDYLYHSCFRFTSALNGDIIRKELLQKIDWMNPNRKDLRIKKQMLKIYEKQLRQIELRHNKQIIEFKKEHEKLCEKWTVLIESKLSKILIMRNSKRQEIRSLNERQLEEIKEEYENRLESIFLTEREDIEKQIKVIDEELLEMENNE